MGHQFRQKEGRHQKHQTARYLQPVRNDPAMKIGQGHGQKDQTEKNAPQTHDGQVKTINHHAAANSRKQLGEKALCRNLCATVAASAL